MQNAIAVYVEQRQMYGGIIQPTNKIGSNGQVRLDERLVDDKSEVYNEVYNTYQEAREQLLVKALKLKYEEIPQGGDVVVRGDNVMLTKMPFTGGEVGLISISQINKGYKIVYSADMPDAIRGEIPHIELDHYFYRYNLESILGNGLNL